MGKLSKEVLQELKLVIKGNTIDAIIPPLIFVLAKNGLGLGRAALGSIIFSVALGMFRIFRKQKWQYAFGGLAGVVVASGFAYYAGNAADYFLPKILGSLAVFLAAAISNLAGRPMAAFASHLSRGWELKWFWREDVKPAYVEVTWLWSLLFLLRSLLLLRLYYKGDLWGLAWMNLLLGFPFTIAILIVSYIYGIWRLKRLGGPGIEEFEYGKKPPWKGQTRGF